MQDGDLHGNVKRKSPGSRGAGVEVLVCQVLRLTCWLLTPSYETNPIVFKYSPGALVCCGARFDVVSVRGFNTSMEG